MKMEDLSEDPTEEEIDAYLATLDFTCAACGEDSRGEAGVGEKFYCHRDERSCYIGARFGEETPVTALYRVVGHSCRSDRPNMRVRRPGTTSLGCEHVRIDTPLPLVEAQRVADLMQRAGLEPHIFEPEETP